MPVTKFRPSFTFTQDRLAKLQALVPEAFADGKINWESLKQALGEFLEDENPQAEHFGLFWPGKREAKCLATMPSKGTLVPVPGEGIDENKTGNIFIEGENLEVLKLLLKSYAGRVKMIYIDPPYNTGNDFVYRDDYKEPLENYLRKTGQADENGALLTTNAKAGGRFHSNWLNMMYSRLVLARQLLREDGVIFMSIDDNEFHNLRTVISEIFGEENFVAQIIWKKRSTPPNDKIIGADHEYISIFAKNISEMGINLRERSGEQLARYRNPDNHPKGPWVPGDLMANIKGGRFVKSLYFPIRNPNTGEDHYPSSDGNWRFNKEKIAELLANSEIYFGEDGKGRPKLKRFLQDVKEGVTYPTIWSFTPLNTVGSNEIAAILVLLRQIMFVVFFGSWRWRRLVAGVESSSVESPLQM